MHDPKDPNPYGLDYDHTVLLDHGLNVCINPDQDAESPREWCNLGTMVCWHSRYRLGDWQDGKSQLLNDLADYNPDVDEDEYLDSPSAKYDLALKSGFLVMPLYLYDHSGLTISTGAFSCPWDSGEIGFIYVTPKQLDKEYRAGGTDISDEEILESAKAALMGEIEVYDKYLRGDVYGYTIEDARGNHLESCYGFYGLDDVICGATEMIDSLIAHPPNTVLTTLEVKLFTKLVGVFEEMSLDVLPEDVTEFIQETADELGILVHPDDFV